MVQVSPEQRAPHVADIDADDEDRPHPQRQSALQHLVRQSETDDPGDPDRQKQDQ